MWQNQLDECYYSQNYRAIGFKSTVAFLGMWLEMATRVVLLGTGTPNIDPTRHGPAVAVIVEGYPYIIDFGPGVVRREIEAGVLGSAYRY